MKVFIIGAGIHYAGFEDSVKAAESRSGCDVVALNDLGCRGKSFHELAPYTTTSKVLESMWDKKGMGWWTLRIISRWATIYDYCCAHDMNEPIFSADWDVMIFDDLNRTHAPFASYDVTWMGLGGSEPYGVKHYQTIKKFIEFCVNEIRAGKRNFTIMAGDRSFNGMDAWARFSLAHPTLTFGDLNQVVNDSIFDRNIQTDTHLFEPDGNCKKIYWQNGQPYFKNISNGKMIKANIIHCWGEYKKRTHELLTQAGI